MSAPQRTDQDTSRSRADESAATGADTVQYEWTVHLLHRDPQRAWGVVVAAVIAAVGAVFFFHSILFAAGGLLLILSSAAEFLFPIRYRLTDDGVTCAFGLTRSEIAWSAVRRLIPAVDGVKLSPLPSPSRLDAFRGVLLRFGPDGQPGDRALVTQFVETQMATSESNRSTRSAQVNASV